MGWPVVFHTRGGCGVTVPTERVEATTISCGQIGDAGGVTEEPAEVEVVKLGCIVSVRSEFDH